MGLRVLHVIRHGRYHSDIDHPGYGHLTPFGETQARYLAEVYAGFQIARLRASTLPRARATADIIHAQLGGSVPRSNSHLLREVIPAATTEHVASEPGLRSFSIPEQMAMLDIEPSLRRAIDENFAEAAGTEVERDRAARAGHMLFKPWRRRGEVHELVVSHGNLIRFLVCGVLGAPPETWLNMNIYHCSITRFIIDANGEVVLDAFNETGHLPADYITMS